MSHPACVPWVILAALFASAAHAGSLAYIANAGENTVSVLDDDGEVIHTITVGPGPGAVAVNPAGTRAYVSLSSEVAVIDVETQTVITRIPGVGPGAFGLVVTPDGTRVYVGNCASPFTSEIAALDATNSTYLHSTSVGVSGSCLLHLAVNPAGTRVYATDTNNGSVVVLDTSDDSIETTITGVPSATGIAVHPVDSRVFVTSFTGPTGILTRIDTDNTIIDTIDVGPGADGVAFNATARGPTSPPPGATRSTSSTPPWGRWRRSSARCRSRGARTGSG